jgi:hypothetical protein
MKRTTSMLKPTFLATVFLGLSCVLLLAADAKIGTGKDFKFPDYYPASNGVRRLKTLVTGSEAHFMTNDNSVIALKNPRLESYAPDGKVEWTAMSPECTVNIKTKEVRGSTNLTFQTADEHFQQTGVGFLWQQSNSVLIIFDQSHTKIDKQALTNAHVKQ